ALFPAAACQPAVRRDGTGLRGGAGAGEEGGRGGLTAAAVPLARQPAPGRLAVAVVRGGGHDRARPAQHGRGSATKLAKGTRRGDNAPAQRRGSVPLTVWWVNPCPPSSNAPW